MTGIRALLAVLAASCAVAGCGPAENDPGPGGVTVGEARALDEAAAMIEKRRLPPEALQTGQPAEQGPQSRPAQPDSSGSRSTEPQPTKP